jgi:hypothetical protein
VNHDGLPFSPVAHIDVLDASAFAEDGSVVSNALPKPLGEWEAEYPAIADTGERAERRPRVSKNALEDLKRDYPWLAEYFPIQGATAYGKKRRVDSDMLPLRDHVSDDELEDDGGDHAVPLAIVLHDHFEGCADFFTRMRDVKIGGSIVSNAGAEAMRGVPREWCGNYGLSTAMSMSMSLYNVEVATSVCNEWCLRNQFFYDLWRGQGGSMTYRYTAAGIASYVPDASWVEFKSQFAPGSKEQARIDVVDCIVPTNL